MRHVAAALVRSGARYFLSFLLIVAVLAAGKLVLEELEEFRLAEKELAELSGSRLQVEAHLRRLQAELQARVSTLEKAPLDRLGERIRAIDAEIVRLSAAQAADGAWLAAIPGPGFVERLRRDAELKLLLHEKDYLTLLRSTLETLQKGPAHLETLRRAHAAAYEKLLQNVRERAQVAQEHRIASRIYGLAPYRRIQALDEAYARLAEENAFAHRSYERQRRLIEAAATARHRFEVRKEHLDDALRPLSEAIRDSEQRNLGSWVRKARDLVASVVPAALLVLVAALLLPQLVKALFYFVLAPMAARRPPVCVVPGTSGAIDFLAPGPSAVSVAFEMGAGEELLVHPEYLQSSPAGTAKDTQWLLDWSHPFSSLAAGMAALIRIRPTEAQTAGISATRDPLSEVAILGLPAGSAIVLQPRTLVAVAHRRTEPLRITTHWRLGSLHAWLTLQLRYVVFHGPARLVVKGCRGVRVEKAGAGRRIDPAATMGFSANLGYSIARCDTFAAYLMGEQDLFNDNFAGEVGFFIYEETQRRGARAGVAGRGLEGFTDSMLKIFGL